MPVEILSPAGCFRGGRCELSSPSPRRSTACISYRSRRDTDRSRHAKVVPNKRELEVPCCAFCAGICECIRASRMPSPQAVPMSFLFRCAFSAKPRAWEFTEILRARRRNDSRCRTNEPEDNYLPNEDPRENGRPDGRLAIYPRSDHRKCDICHQSWRRPLLVRYRIETV